jgi:hypothetical protein
MITDLKVTNLDLAGQRSIVEARNQTVQASAKSCLAASAWTRQDDKFAPLDLQTDVGH